MSKLTEHTKHGTPEQKFCESFQNNSGRRRWKKEEKGEIDKIHDRKHDEHKDEIDNVFELTDSLANYIIKEKKGKIYPNVDLYSAGLLHVLGIPTPLFPPLFAAVRSAGWISHAIEQLSDNKLIRPRLRYVGELDKKFLKIGER